MIAGDVFGPLGSHLGAHAGFILGAYAFTALVIGALILRAVADNRAQKRALEAFDRAGERP